MSLHKRYADVTYPASDLAALAAAVTEARAKVASMPTESAVTVKRLAKIGMRSESFARDALDLGSVHAGLLPRDLDLARMAANLENREALRTLLAQIEQLYVTVRT